MNQASADPLAASGGDTAIPRRSAIPRGIPLRSRATAPLRATAAAVGRGSSASSIDNPSASNTPSLLSGNRPRGATATSAVNNRPRWNTSTSTGTTSNSATIAGDHPRWNTATSAGNPTRGSDGPASGGGRSAPRGTTAATGGTPTTPTLTPRGRGIDQESPSRDEGFGVRAGQKSKKAGGGKDNGKGKEEEEPATSSAGGKQGRKTHLLVLHGGIHEAWPGDFLALVELFSQRVCPTFGADFWTLYPPKQYFRDFPHRHTIKFREKVMATRANKTFYEDERRWSVYDQTEICAAFYRWLDVKADPEHKNGAQPGDTIVLIVLAHGNQDKFTGHGISIRLGNNDVLVDDFVAAIRKFPPSIQVNCFTNACFAASFAQAIAADLQASRWIQVASQSKMLAFPAERSISGRQNYSLFIAGLVKSFEKPALGRGNLITVAELQANLDEEMQKRIDANYRSTGFAYTDANLATEVHSLLLRKFSEFPFNTQNTAARRRRDMSAELLARPIPLAATLNDKADFAESLIVAQRDAFGSQDAHPHDHAMEVVTREPHMRLKHAPNILRQLFIRGRMQTIMLDCFLELCYRGACSLSSFEHPINWFEAPSDCLIWIRRMMYLFDIPDRSWDDVQTEWEIDAKVRAISYRAPVDWLCIMIARSFTNFDDVFNILRVSGLTGLVDSEKLATMRRDYQPDLKWKADSEFLRNETVHGNGTIGWWIPEAVDPFILKLPFDWAVAKIVNNFRYQIEGIERGYAGFFEVSLQDMPPPLWHEPGEEELGEPKYTTDWR